MFLNRILLALLPIAGSLAEPVASSNKKSCQNGAVTVYGRQCTRYCGYEFTSGSYKNDYRSCSDDCVTACAKDSKCKSAKWSKSSKKCYYNTNSSPYWQKTGRGDGVKCNDKPKPKTTTKCTTTSKSTTKSTSKSTSTTTASTTPTTTTKSSSTTTPSSTTTSSTTTSITTTTTTTTTTPTTTTTTTTTTTAPVPTSCALCDNGGNDFCGIEGCVCFVRTSDMVAVCSLSLSCQACTTDDDCTQNPTDTCSFDCGGYCGTVGEGRCIRVSTDDDGCGIPPQFPTTTTTMTTTTTTTSSAAPAPTCASCDDNGGNELCNAAGCACTVDPSNGRATCAFLASCEPCDTDDDCAPDQTCALDCQGLCELRLPVCIVRVPGVCPDLPASAKRDLERVFDEYEGVKRPHHRRKFIGGKLVVV